MAYPVSELYKEAISNLSRSSYISGTLVLSDNTVIELSNETVSQGSFYVTNQCVNSDAFTYGSVFAAEMGMSIKTEIDRYTLSGSYVLPFFSLKLSDGTYEKIPLGKFYVTEPNRIGRSISLKCYDGMTLLDVGITENTTGTAFELLEWTALNCGIELSQTAEEIALLPNSAVLLSVESDRVQTYRDLIAYIGSVTCTFAIFDREGKLKLVQFATEVSKTIYGNQRDASKFSDFQTYFTAISASFIAEGVYRGYTKSIEGQGLVYKVGDVPIIQGTDLSNQSVLDSIFSKLTLVKYTPCDISFSGDPSIDLGDMIMNIDRQGNEILSLVTFYKWTYRGKHQIKSAGANPKIGEVKSKTEKELEAIAGNITMKEIVVYSYTNASTKTIQGGEAGSKNLKEVAKISFAVNADVTALITTTVCFDLNVQGCVEFSMYVDSVYQEGSTVGQHCLEGPSTVSFTNYIPCEKGKTYRVTILARTYALYEENDVPKMVIPKFNVKCVVFGQGIATKVPWDGTLSFTDVLPTIQAIPSNVVYTAKFSEEVSTQAMVPTRVNAIEVGIKDIMITPRTIKVENYFKKTVEGSTWADLASTTWKSLETYSWGKEGL